MTETLDIKAARQALSPHLSAARGAVVGRTRPRGVLDRRLAVAILGWLGAGGDRLRCRRVLSRWGFGGGSGDLSRALGWALEGYGDGLVEDAMKRSADRIASRGSPSGQE